MRTETKKGQEKEIVTGIREEKRTLKIQKDQKKRAPWTDPKKVTEAERDRERKKMSKNNVIGREEETEMLKKVKIRRVAMKGESDIGNRIEVKKDTENMTGVKRNKENGIGVKTEGKRRAVTIETGNKEETETLKRKENETDTREAEIETPIGKGEKTVKINIEGKKELRMEIKIRTRNKTRTGARTGKRTENGTEIETD